MRIKRKLAALAVLASMSGCATGQGLMTDLGFGGGDAADTRGSSNVQAVWRENVNVTITGRLNLRAADPNQCHILSVPGEDPYALVGPLDRVVEGSTIQVTGTLAAWSTCDTYRTLRVTNVRPVPQTS